MPEPILEAASLTKHFGALRAVHLDLTVEAGELRCLIGPNGAGKSTFFRMLSGADAPELWRRSGSAAVTSPAGRAFRVARLGISIKFQVASVLEELSVFRNLHLAAEFRFGNREGRRRAAEMLEVVGLHRACRPPGDLALARREAVARDRHGQRRRAVPDPARRADGRA